MRRTQPWATSAIFALILTAFIYSAYRGHTLSQAATGVVSTNLGVLPYYALRSFLRMSSAYLLSVLFALVYGTAAGLNKRLEKVLLPILDILQSVPILGFFPAAVYFFVTLFQGRTVGVELASIFLIFTSQAWNMAFGVYEAVTTVPPQMAEALDAYGVRGWLRYLRLYLPASVPKLVYNSVVSWAAGWYFLSPAEVIGSGLLLPGLGSFASSAAQQGRLSHTMAAVGVLVSIVVTMNIFIWRPLSLWAERFRYEFSPAGGETGDSFAYEMWRHSGFFRMLRRVFSRLLERVFGALFDLGARLGARQDSKARRRTYTLLKGLINLSLAGLGLYVAFSGVRALVMLLSQPLPSEAGQIWLALLASSLRLAVAFLISLAWTIPTAVALGHNDRLAQFLQPVLETLAAVPATALFPVIVYFLATRPGGMNVASILLVLTGMQWYLLFNTLSGVRSIPRDMKEAARSFGLKGWLYWRRVVLPAIVPSVITGSITAIGGGWNALIVSEYVTYKHEVLKAFGIGYLLDKAVYETQNFQMVWLSLAGMVLAIFLLNHFVWRRLYDRASVMFRMSD
ncbi:MAG: ABC transporter permease subunit [Firmicutes bacterium]|nr:ABC transporter permease subunit [Bacillota bacterium]